MNMKELLPGIVVILLVLSVILIIRIGFYQGSWKKILLLIAVFGVISNLLLWAADRI